ncbi:MAG: transglycosylase SLT domain-containing protein [Methylococcales bacterium]|nr:transglycosylase SLT domain-containing protein [Methylococcales bacterium]
MILINSNRLLGYLLFLVVITLLGCSSKQSSTPIVANTLDKDGVLFVKKIDKDGVLFVKTLDKDGVEFAHIDKDGVKTAKKSEPFKTVPLKTMAKQDGLFKTVPLKKMAKKTESFKFRPLKQIAKKEILPAIAPQKIKAIRKIAKAPRAIKRPEFFVKKSFFPKPIKRISINKSGSSTIWKRMFALYALPNVDNKRVDRQIKRFLKHPEQLVKIQRRAEPYLHLIMDEIETKKIPGELALLPIIESSYRATVTSPASAAGLWQFIPSTGLSFGLKQNWWYDGRRDVYASTQAATHYLKKLSKSFHGDWFLALASYNVGIGNVKKAIRRNRRSNLKTDYWTLRLPKETRDYVPKLLALAKLFAQAEKYNLPLKPIPNKPFFKSVEINSPLGLKKAANMARMNFDDFFILNPAFNRVITPPTGSYRLLVKTQNAKSFKQNLSNLPEHKRVDWIKHVTRDGESLRTIARQHNIKIKDLLKVNNLNRKQIKNIGAGTTLKIPPASIDTLVKGNV